MAEVAEEVARSFKQLEDDARNSVVRAALAEAGALEVIVEKMTRHPGSAQVQEHSSSALASVCLGTDQEGVSRQQRAADAGALMRVVSAMQQHRDRMEVQNKGSLAIGNICFGDENGDVAAGRKKLAVDAGALEVLVEAMLVHGGSTKLQNNASYAVGILCAGSDAESVARQQRAVEAGVLEPLVAAMQRHPKDDNVQGNCIRALRRCCVVAGAVRLQQLAKPLAEMLRRVKHFPDSIQQDAAAILSLTKLESIGADPEHDAKSFSVMRRCATETTIEELERYSELSYMPAWDYHSWC